MGSTSHGLINHGWVASHGMMLKDPKHPMTPANLSEMELEAYCGFVDKKDSHLCGMPGATTMHTSSGRWTMDGDTRWVRGGSDFQGSGSPHLFCLGGHMCEPPGEPSANLNSRRDHLEGIMRVRKRGWQEWREEEEEREELLGIFGSAHHFNTQPSFCRLLFLLFIDKEQQPHQS
ncbi:hypothetical protein NQZ68_008926 [Dissostichus eleginoides]|nr:hypothetical protein NQZ68_008926 [Dissostichus eleginoides]